VIVPDYLTHFRFAGRIVAMALLHELPVQIDLTKSLLKHILKRKLYIKDLEDVKENYFNFFYSKFH
jgi:hypothetical protein